LNNPIQTVEIDWFTNAPGTHQFNMTQITEGWHFSRQLGKKAGGADISPPNV